MKAQALEQFCSSRYPEHIKILEEYKTHQQFIKRPVEEGDQVQDDFDPEASEGEDSQMVEG